jgi:hypothetical protein
MFRRLSLLLLVALASLTLAGLSRATPANASDACYFVFVPLPCPNQQAYQASQTFMDAIALQADRLNIKVYVVRACYNQEENLAKSRRNDWWWDEIQKLPERYAILVDRGTVSIVDSFADLPLEYTPSGYFYRGGKLRWTGQLNTSNPSDVLADLVHSGQLSDIR